MTFISNYEDDDDDEYENTFTTVWARAANLRPRQDTPENAPIGRGASMKIIRNRTRRGMAFQTFDFLGLDMNHIFAVLQLSFDHQKRFLGDDQAIGLEQ